MKNIKNIYKYFAIIFGFIMGLFLFNSVTTQAYVFYYNGNSAVGVKYDTNGYITDVKDEVIISRIINRRLCPSCGRGYNLVSLQPKIEGVCDDCGTALYQRKDDNEETIKSRLEVYNRQTKPLIEYYENQNLLLQIDGDGKISEVADKIIAGMEAN